MEFYEYPLLDYPSLMLALLKVPIQGRPPMAIVSAICGQIWSAPTNTPGRDYWSRGTASGSASPSADARCSTNNPMGINDVVLLRFPEFREFIHQAIQQLSHDDPHSGEYEEGYLAFQEGRKHTDNPYASDSIKHLAWENGWFEGRDEVGKGRHA